MPARTDDQGALPPLFKPAPQDWPEPWEQVDLFWAKLALEWGKPVVLARYLRETKAVDPFVLSSIARMMSSVGSNQRRWRLEPRYLGRGRPTKRRPAWPLTPTELAALLDQPERARPRWRLKFVARKGSPGDPRRYWRQQAIGLEVWSGSRRDKLYWVVEQVARRRRVSPATVYAALKSFSRGKPRRKEKRD